MWRALRGTLGVVLAIGAVLPARSASAQSSGSRLWYGAMPIQKENEERVPALQEGHSRLEEMKVELALLADIATFPYHLSVRAAGEMLVLGGYVPNDLVRRHAVEAARRSTFLTVRDDLRVQPNLTPPPRSLEVLQEEGTELLRRKLDESARRIALSARPNGIVVLTGRIDSVEGKVEASRLLRQLSGCTGVVNELIVEQTLRDGQRVVQVTRDGSSIVPPSALGLAAQPLAAPSPMPGGEKKPSAPLAKSPRSFDALDGELRLPTAAPLKPANAQAKRVEKKGTNLESLPPAQLPAKWGWSAMSWESQEKKRESAPAARTTSLATTKPVVVASNKPRPANDSSRSSAEKPQEEETPTMTWHRPSSSEESEANAPAPSKPPQPPMPLPAMPTPAPARPTTAPIQPSLRWPPAYESRPPESYGRAGIITFDDDSPQPKPVPTPKGTSQSVAAANLQRQVQSVCGRQAQEVLVEMRPNGGILVKVKVPNISTSDQLSQKILSIPEMTAPNVRLLMDVGP